MIRRLFAAYLQWLVDIDLKELDDGVRDGTASGTWVVALLQDINERRAFIEALRAHRPGRPPALSPLERLALGFRNLLAR